MRMQDGRRYISVRVAGAYLLLVVIAINFVVRYFPVRGTRLSAPVGDILSFIGSILGAAIGVVTVFLAVHLQQQADDRRHFRTMSRLLARLKATAEDLRERHTEMSMGPTREVFRAFIAARETADAMKTNSAGIATVASQLKHTSFFPKLDHLNSCSSADPSEKLLCAKNILTLCESLILQLEID